jgi:predicted transglutaminase-like cysteine proteinase
LKSDDFAASLGPESFTNTGERLLRAIAIFVFITVFGASPALSENASNFLVDGSVTAAPPGLSQLCQSFSLKQICSKGEGSDVPLKHDAFVVQYINRRVNAEKTYVSDLSRHTLPEKWLNPENESAVDCEEFAIAKQQLLLRQLFQRASLRLVLTMDERRRFAILLSYAAPDGDYILDYRNNDLLKWNETGYYFVARQSAEDPQIWRSLNWVRGGTASFAKDIVKRPAGKDWTSCVVAQQELPSEVMQATTAAPEETFEAPASTPLDFKMAATNFQYKWQGYKPVTQIKDKAVVDWSKRVFRIYSFGQRSKGERPTVVDLSNPKKSIKGNMKVLKADRDFQVETCKRQKLMRCPVFAQLTAGTAFRVGKDTYYTCRHNVDTWLTWASELNGIPQASISPPLALTEERKGKISKILFYSGLPRKQKYKAKLFSPEPRLKSDREDNAMQYNADAYFQRASDIVVFGLSSGKTTIETAGQIKLADVKPGEGAFLIGYPGKFKLFPKGEGDSKGDRLYASHGTIVGNTVFLGDEGKIAEFSNFGYPGNSGGPLVREDGTLVGMVCYADDMDRTKLNTHSYITTTDASVIEAWWKSLPAFPEPKFKLPDGYAN